MIGSTSRIALVNPLGDPGIGTYTHELAEALVGCGVAADVFTASEPWVQALPRRHRLYPVIGSALVRQRGTIRMASAREVVGSDATTATPSSSPVARPSRAPQILKRAFRDTYLSVELAVWLRTRGYKVIWTQWPSVPKRGMSMWSSARAVGLRVVHTAHNVFPHERASGDREQCAHVYDSADTIVVHSNAAMDALAREFPFAADKLVVARHGLYTSYPPSVDGRARIRRELGIPADRTLALFFGGIRPYKNIDGVIEALVRDRDRTFDLLVAGRESGYTDADPGDPLGRTRRLVERGGVRDRAHLMLGPFTSSVTSDLIAAADVVLLPYLESWGSGLLLLAMSFGKPVIVTATGGMDEYVRNYPASIVLRDASPERILEAIGATTERGLTSRELPSRPPDLEWTHIVPALLPRILPNRPGLVDSRASRRVAAITAD